MATRPTRGGGKGSSRDEDRLSDPLRDRDLARRSGGLSENARRWPPGLSWLRLALGVALVALLVLVVAGTTVHAAEAGFVAVPAKAARVTDQAGMLTAQQRAALEGVLADYERKSGSQIAVLLLPSTAPEAIEQYSIRVADAWKLGRRGVDDGVLLVVAKDNPSSLRRLRIEAGRGVQGTLTDAQSKRVLQDVIAPHFRQNDFYGGLAAGVSAIATLLDKERLPAPPGRPQGSQPGADGVAPASQAGVEGMAAAAGAGAIAGAAGRPADAAPTNAREPGNANAPGASRGAGATDATDGTSDAHGAGTTDATDGTGGARGTGTAGAADGTGGARGAGETDATDGTGGAGGARGAGARDADDGADGAGGWSIGWALPLLLFGVFVLLPMMRGGSRRGLRRGGWGSDATGVLLGAALGNALSAASRGSSGGSWGSDFGGGDSGGGFSGGGGSFDGGGASGDW